MQVVGLNQFDSEFSSSNAFFPLAKESLAKTLFELQQNQKLIQSNSKII